MKRIKKILAVMLVLVMSMALAAGCSQKTKQTMFSIMKDAGTMTKYSYNADMKLESSISGLENLALTFKGVNDGGAMSVGAKVSYSFITVDVDNFITLTKDAVYVNVQTVFEKLAPILLGSSYTLEDFEDELGVELKCIKFPLVDGLVKLDGNSEELVNTYVSILENAFKDVKIDEEKGVFTARIEGAEQFSKVVDAFLTGLLDNKDTILAELDKNAIDEAKLTELLNLYMDEAVNAVEKFNTDYELGLTDDDIAELRDEAKSAVEEAVSEAELDDANSVYEDAFADISDNKDELVSDIADFEDGTADLTVSNSLTGKEGSRVYTSNIELNVENTSTDEDLQLKINSVITEDSKVSVSVPSSYTQFSDVLYAALVFAYENDMLDDLLYGDMYN